MIKRMEQGLINHIRKFTALNDADAALIFDYLKPIGIKKKDFLLKEGEICRYNYFVVKGCLRMYFINLKGTEQITQFALENWWLADHMSLMMQKPGQFNIQAVEDSEILALDHSVQDRLFEKVPKMETYFRLMMQRAYAAAQMRVKYLYAYSKEETYEQFSSAFPEFVQRIPQYMLASYLDFTPEYLSGLRKKKARGQSR